MEENTVARKESIRMDFSIKKMNFFFIFIYSRSIELEIGWVFSISK